MLEGGGEKRDCGRVGTTGGGIWAGPRGGIIGRSVPRGERGGVMGADGVMTGGGMETRDGAAALAGVAAGGGGGVKAGRAGACTGTAGAAALGGAAAAFCSASSTANVNLGLAPFDSGSLISARCRAACTRCSARRSCASRWALSFSASFSPLATGGAAAAVPRGGAALTPGRGAIGAGFTAAGRAAAGGPAGGENSSAMRGISLPAPMPRRSRQLRLSVPLLEFWSIPFARSYISSTGLTPRMPSPLARE